MLFSWPFLEWAFCVSSAKFAKKSDIGNSLPEIFDFLGIYTL